MQNSINYNNISKYICIESLRNFLYKYNLSITGNLFIVLSVIFIICIENQRS